MFWPGTGMTKLITNRARQVPELLSLSRLARTGTGMPPNQGTRGETGQGRARSGNGVQCRKGRRRQGAEKGEVQGGQDTKGAGDGAHPGPGLGSGSGQVGRGLARSRDPADGFIQKTASQCQRYLKRITIVR